jgi:hypothetical protein
MGRCLAAERIIADGITIFVRRIINFDIRKAMNGLPTPVRGMEQLFTTERLNVSVITFRAPGQQDFASRKPWTIDRRNLFVRISMAQGSFQRAKAADISTYEDAIQ